MKALDSFRSPHKVRPFFAVLLFVLCACGESTAKLEDAAAHAGAKSVVATSFYPLTWLVERLAGDAVEIVCPLPAGEDPSSWQPSRAALAVFQGADLIVLNGAEFEKWAAAASLPQSRVVETANGFRERWRTLEGLVHAHGGKGAHSHTGIDGHTWLAPTLFFEQAQAVARALRERGLVPAAELARNEKALQDDLLAAWAVFTGSIPPQAEGVRILANHPAYDYVLGAAEIELVNLDLDPAAAWDEAMRAAVASAIAGAERAVLLWESAPRDEVAAALRDELGVESVLFSPAENPSSAELADGDFLAIQRANHERLAQALR